MTAEEPCPITRILVPLDGSRLADAIIGHVRRLLVRRDRTAVHLLRVVEADDLGEAEQLAARLEARTHLAALRQVLTGHCGAVHTLVTTGDPVEEVLDVVHERGIDLIAMSTHGRSGLGRWLRGSVAERVLRRSPVPVFLATPAGVHLAGDDLELRRILVPLDGTAGSAQVLPVAGELALRAGAELTLLHVTAPVDFGVDPQRRAEELLGPSRELLERVGLRVQVEGRRGDPAEVILNVADGHDLLALSTHGRSGIARWRMGSIAEAVLRRSRCPVLAYKHDEA